MASKIGFIGCGNMGSALVLGLIQRDVLGEDDIVVFDKLCEKTQLLQGQESISSADSALDLVTECDVIFLAVKPQNMGELLDEISGVSEGKLFISIAAGIKLDFIESRLSDNARVVRVMPNTPAMVYEMAAGYALGKNASEEDAELIRELFNGLGLALKVEEDQLHAVTGLSGSGPAYFYYFIDELCAAAVKEGVSEDVALALAAQTAKGAAEMILSGKGTPRELIDSVCSPGGTTLAGMKVLDDNKVGVALRKTVAAATKRSRELGK